MSEIIDSGPSDPEELQKTGKWLPKRPLLHKLLDNWEITVVVGSFLGTGVGTLLVGGNPLGIAVPPPKEFSELGIKIWIGTVVLSAPGYLVMGARYAYTKFAQSHHGHK